MDYELFQIADAIRIFKGLTITELASETKINRGNLNAWLNSGAPDRLSSDKIKKIFDYLEVDLDPLRLRPGIHRFTIPKPTIYYVNLIIEVMAKLFPEGGTVFPVRKKSYSETGWYEFEFDNESFFSGTQGIILVAVPKFIHDVRVILKMAEKKHLMPARSLPSPFPGVTWHLESNLRSRSNCGRELPDQVFSRWVYDESLTVSELDKILFNPVLGGFDSSEYEGLMEWENSMAMEGEGAIIWTWERLVSSLKEQGKSPDEVAKKLGL
ncbi:MAG: helix-turn-helix domain-containing protein [Leptospirillum sp.]